MHRVVKLGKDAPVAILGPAEMGERQRSRVRKGEEMCKRNIVETRVAGTVMAGATGEARALAGTLVAECCSPSLPEDRARLLLLLVSPSWCCPGHAELPKLIR